MWLPSATGKIISESLKDSGIILPLPAEIQMNYFLLFWCIVGMTSLRRIDNTLINLLLDP